MLVFELCDISIVWVMQIFLLLVCFFNSYFVLLLMYFIVFCKFFVLFDFTSSHKKKITTERAIM